MEVREPSARYLVRRGYKLTEVGVIPEDWKVTTVGDEFGIQLGKMLDAEKNSGIHKVYLGNRAVQWGRFEIEDLGTMKMTPADLPRFRLRLGDLLVCEGGEIGRAAVWNNPIQECYFQKTLHRLRPIRGCNVQLMLNMLQRLASTGFLQSFVTQTSIAHLPKDKFEIVPIALPPTKAEQEAIAEALSDADALIESLEQLITKKRNLKQGAMQELLTGKRRLPGFSGEWEEVRLGQIGTFTKGRGVTKDQAQSGPLACVRYGEIYTRHNDYIKSFHSWISREVAATATKLRRGDVLFAGSGETKEEIGKCIAFTSDVEAYAGGDIVILRPVSADSAFLGYYLNTSPINAQKAGKGQGDAVVHISASALSDIDVTMPRIEEQTAIATVLSDMDTELAALEAKLTKARHIKQGMMQELLTGRIRLV